MKYRPDIDGLRAVAVLPVVLYHLGISAIPGGFVGVDVFFVISGYLIGSDMLRRVEGKNFSIVDFYDRRIRRIIPALLAMIVAVTAAGYFLLYPIQYVDYAKSAIAATISVSNIHFFNQSGYFDGPAHTKPMLHTWSLSVEEQFYLILPVLVIVSMHFSRGAHHKKIISAVMFLSLCLSAVGVFKYPDATFYLIPTRAWELLLGMSVGFVSTKYIESKVALRLACAAVGIFLIIFSYIRISSYTPFPGLAALPACLGTAMVIFAGSAGVSGVGLTLSSSPLVFIGKISYSLYLWHWPIIVLLEQKIGRSGLPPVYQAIAFAGSVSMAIVSWALIETPARRMKISRRAVFLSSAGAGGVVIAAAAAIIANAGFPQRYSPEVRLVASYIAPPNSEPDYFRPGTCFLSSKYKYENFVPNICLRNEAGGRNIVVVGDSHAAAIWDGLSRSLKNDNVMQATASGCRPTVTGNDKNPDRCRLLLRDVFQGRALEGVDLVVLAGRWTSADLPHLKRTVEWAAEEGVPLVVVGPALEYDMDLPQVVIRSIDARDPAIIDAHRTSAPLMVDRQMRGLLAGTEATYVSQFDLLCSEGRCAAQTPAGIPLAFDYGHFTREGSLFVGEKISKLPPFAR